MLALVPSWMPFAKNANVAFGITVVEYSSARSAIASCAKTISLSTRLLVKSSKRRTLNVSATIAECISNC